MHADRRGAAAENRLEGRPVFYPVELLVFAMNLIFAACSLVNLGKASAVLFGLAVDRELLMGILFLVLNPAILLGIRAVNPLRGQLPQFFRMTYVQALYVLYFTESIWLSQLMFGGAYFDPFFAHLDFLIFGFQPSIEFSRHLESSRLINEVFFFSYFFYYALVTTGVWFLFARRRYREAARMLFIISAAFFVLYVWFIFFPVKGPKYYFEQLHEVWYSNFRGYFFTRVVKETFNNTNLGGAAFPSSHVALAIISILLNWRYNRFVVPIYLPLTILLFLSTIYLYAHYFVDIPAGVVAGVILWFTVPRLLHPVGALTERLGLWFRRRWGYAPIGLPGTE
jgi:membrane-associated phospholipid phosphatase